MEEISISTFFLGTSLCELVSSGQTYGFTFLRSVDELSRRVIFSQTLSVS